MARAYKKSSYSHFEDALVLFNKNPDALCDKLGYHESSWLAWRDAGQMPAVAALACQQMLDLKNSQAKSAAASSPSKLFTVRVPPARASSFGDLLEQLNYSYSEVAF
jgi:hypothetical protein